MVMAESNGELVFDTLEPITVKVTLGPRKYLLFEAGAAATALYRSAQARVAKMRDGKVVGVEGVGEIEPILVGACLAECGAYFDPIKDRQGNVKFVGTDFVKRIQKAGIVKQLFDKVKEISPDLDGQLTEEQLTRQIDTLTKMRDQLRKAKEEDPNVEDAGEVQAKN